MAPTVLIADADTLCDQYRRFFSYQGWHVQTSGDGLECLAELRRFSPDVLILDLQLLWGGADGLLAVMGDDPDLAHVPVILTSTEGSAEVLSGVVSSRAVQSLRKPFSLTALLDLVRSEPGNRQPMSRKKQRSGQGAMPWSKSTMLVLSRKPGEEVVMGDDIRVGNRGDPRQPGPAP